MQSHRVRRPGTLPARACVNCQRRKSRCSRANNASGPCSYCSRTGKTCSFEEPPSRTALTRGNLDEAERMCARLRSLLQARNPDLDIDAALQDLEQQQQKEKPKRIPVEVEFEWHEGPCSPVTDTLGPSPVSKDGMAILNGHDAGYLGSSSGSDLLKEIASHLPQLSPAYADVEGPSTDGEHVGNSTVDDTRMSYFASAAVKSRLVDAYFLFYNSCYPILHEKTFREQLSHQHQNEQPLQSAWPIIYYMVLAIGHWISTSNKSGELSPYYTAARSRLSMHLLESGTMESVQAFLLMGNYLQKTDRPNTGYNFVGIAYRIALGLGLHREIPHAPDNVLHERRRRLFWVLFCFDSGFNITTGRPPTVFEGFVDCRLPRNVDDRECALDAPVPPSIDCPTPYSAILAQAQLASLASTIYTEFLLAKTAKAKIEYQIAESLDDRLRQWRQSLPVYFTAADVPAWFFGPRSVVLWKEQNVRILLWRGSKRHHSFLPSKPDAESRCHDVAMQTIHDIAHFCITYQDILHLGINWYATYFLFQAALVLEACHIHDGSPTTPDWEATIATARECLTTLAHNNISASRCLVILDRIHQDMVRASHAEGRLETAPDRSAVSATDGPPYAVAPEADLSVPALVETEDPELDLGLGSFAADHTLRMLIDQMPLDWIDDSQWGLFGNELFHPEM